MQSYVSSILSSFLKLYFNNINVDDLKLSLFNNNVIVLKDLDINIDYINNMIHSNTYVNYIDLYEIIEAKLKYIKINISSFISLNIDIELDNINIIFKKSNYTLNKLKLSSKNEKLKIFDILHSQLLNIRNDILKQSNQYVSKVLSNIKINVKNINISYRDDFELLFKIDYIKIEPIDELHSRKIDINGIALYFDNLKNKRDCLLEPFDINIVQIIENNGYHKNDILNIDIKPIFLNFNNMHFYSLLNSFSIINGLNGKSNYRPPRLLWNIAKRKVLDEIRGHKCYKWSFIQEFSRDFKEYTAAYKSLVDDGKIDEKLGKNTNKSFFSSALGNAFGLGVKIKSDNRTEAIIKERMQIIELRWPVENIYIMRSTSWYWYYLEQSILKLYPHLLKSTPNLGFIKLKNLLNEQQLAAITAEFYSIGYPSFSPIDPELINFEINRMKQTLYNDLDVEMRNISLNLEKMEIKILNEFKNDSDKNSCLVNVLSLSFGFETISLSQRTSILESNSVLTISNFFINDGTRLILNKFEDSSIFLTLKSNSNKNDVDIILCRMVSILYIKFFVDFYSQFSTLDYMVLESYNNSNKYNSLESNLEKSYSLYLNHVPLFRGIQGRKGINFVLQSFQIEIPLINSYSYSDVNDFDRLLVSFSLSVNPSSRNTALSDFLNPFYDKISLDCKSNETLSNSEKNRLSFFNYALTPNSPWYMCNKISFTDVSFSLKSNLNSSDLSNKFQVDINIFNPISNHFCLLPEFLLHCYVSEVILTFTSVDINKIYYGLKHLQSINFKIKEKKRSLSIPPHFISNTFNNMRNSNLSLHSKSMTDDDSMSFYSCISLEEQNEIREFQDVTLDPLAEMECKVEANEVLQYYSQKRIHFTINSISILLPDPRPMMTSHLNLKITNVCYLNANSGKNNMNYLTFKDLTINDKLDLILNFCNSSINTSNDLEDNFCFSFYSNEWNESYLLSYFEINAPDTSNELPLELSSSIYSSKFNPRSFVNKSSLNEGVLFNFYFFYKVELFHSSIKFSKFNLTNSLINLSPDWIRTFQLPMSGFSELCGIELLDNGNLTIKEKEFVEQLFLYPESTKYLNSSSMVISANILLDLANYLRFSAKLDSDYIENSSFKNYQINILEMRVSELNDISNSIWTNKNLYSSFCFKARESKLGLAIKEYIVTLKNSQLLILNDLINNFNELDLFLDSNNASKEKKLIKPKKAVDSKINISVEIDNVLAIVYLPKNDNISSFITSFSCHFNKLKLNYSTFDCNNLESESDFKFIRSSFDLTFGVIPNFKYLPNVSIFNSSTRKPYLYFECSSIEYCGPVSFSKVTNSGHAYEPGELSINNVIWPFQFLPVESSFKLNILCLDLFIDDISVKLSEFNFNFYQSMVLSDNLLVFSKLSFSIQSFSLDILSITEKFQSVLKLVSFDKNTPVNVELISKFELLTGILIDVLFNYEVTSFQVLLSEDSLSYIKTKLDEVELLRDFFLRNMKKPLSSIAAINLEKSEIKASQFSLSPSKNASGCDLFLKSIIQDYRSFIFTSHINIADVSYLYCFMVDNECYAFLMHQHLKIDQSGTIDKQNIILASYPNLNSMIFNFGFSLSLLLSTPDSFQIDQSYSSLNEDKSLTKLPFYVVSPLNIYIVIENKSLCLNIKKPEIILTFLVISLLKFATSHILIESKPDIIKKKSASPTSENMQYIKTFEVLNKLNDWKIDFNFNEWSILLFDDSPSNFSPLLLIMGSTMINFGNTDSNFEFFSDYNPQYSIECCISDLEILCFNGNRDSVLESTSLDVLLLVDRKGNQIFIKSDSILTTVSCNLVNAISKCMNFNTTVPICNIVNGTGSTIKFTLGDVSFNLNSQSKRKLALHDWCIGGIRSISSRIPSNKINFYFNIYSSSESEWLLCSTDTSTSLSTIGSFTVLSKKSNLTSISSQPNISSRLSLNIEPRIASYDRDISIASNNLLINESNVSFMIRIRHVSKAPRHFSKNDSSSLKFNEIVYSFKLDSFSSINLPYSLTLENEKEEYVIEVRLYANDDANTLKLKWSTLGSFNNLFTQQIPSSVSCHSPSTISENPGDIASPSSLSHIGNSFWIKTKFRNERGCTFLHIMPVLILENTLPREIVGYLEIVEFSKTNSDLYNRSFLSQSVFNHYHIPEIPFVIPAGEKLYLHAFDPFSVVYLCFEMENFGMSEKIPVFLPELNKNTDKFNPDRRSCCCSLKLPNKKASYSLVPDSYLRPLKVCFDYWVSLDQNFILSSGITIYVPYWICNRTGLQLFYSEVHNDIIGKWIYSSSNYNGLSGNLSELDFNSSNKITPAFDLLVPFMHSNQWCSELASLPSILDAIMYSPNAATLSLKLNKGPIESEKDLTPCSLKSNSSLLLPEGTGFIARLNTFISPCDGVFHRTKVLKILPTFMVFNQTHLTINIASISPGKLPNENYLIAVSPKDYCPIYYSTGTKNFIICQIYEKNLCQCVNHYWSDIIQVDTLMRQVITLRTYISPNGLCPTHKSIKVSTSESSYLLFEMFPMDGSLQLVISKAVKCVAFPLETDLQSFQNPQYLELLSIAPCRIENNTDYPIMIEPNISPDIIKLNPHVNLIYDIVPARQRAFYNWDYPSLVQDITAKFFNDIEILEDRNLYLLRDVFSFDKLQEQELSGTLNNLNVRKDIFMDGPVTVMRLSTYSKDDFQSLVFGVQMTPFVAESKTSTNHLQIYIKEFSLSVVDHIDDNSFKLPYELLLLTVRDIDFSYKITTMGTEIHYSIDMFQIDNQMIHYFTKSPVLITSNINCEIPETQDLSNIDDSNKLDIASMSSNHSNFSKRNLYKYFDERNNAKNLFLMVTIPKYHCSNSFFCLSNFNLRIMPLEFHTEDEVLLILVDFIHKVSKSMTNSSKTANKSSVADSFTIDDEWLQSLEEKIITMRSTRKSIFVNKFEIAPIQVSISYSPQNRYITYTASKLSNEPIREYLRYLETVLVSINSAPVFLNKFVIENQLFISTRSLSSLISTHYQSDALRQVYNIVGSSDSIGNPIGLFSSVSKGLDDFLSTSNWFIGGKLFFRHSILGLSNSAHLLSTSFARTLHAFERFTPSTSKLHLEFLNNNAEDDEKSDYIQNQQLNLFDGIYHGLESLISAPWVGLANQGPSGFLFGMLEGVSGLIVFPLVGGANYVSNSMHSIKEEMEATLVLFKNSRIRSPRIFLWNHYITPINNIQLVASHFIEGYLKEQVKKIAQNIISKATIHMIKLSDCENVLCYFFTPLTQQLLIFTNTKVLLFHVPSSKVNLTEFTKNWSDYLLYKFEIKNILKFEIIASTPLSFRILFSKSISPNENSSFIQTLSIPTTQINNLNIYYCTINPHPFLQILVKKYASFSATLPIPVGFALV